MKRKNLLKVGLLAAGLLVGSNVWADKNYSQVFNYTFENSSTYTDGWSITGTASQFTINSDQYIKFVLNGKNATQTQTLDFSSSVTGVTDYKFSFDYGYSPMGSSQKGTGWAETILTVYDSDNSELFHLTADAGTGAVSVSVINSSGTTIGTFTSAGRYADPGIANIYTFTITGDSESGTVLAIKNVSTGAAVTLSNATLNAAFKLPAKIVNTLQSSTGGASFTPRAVFDDIYFGQAVTGAYASAPTFTFSKVSGNDRVYTLTNSNGNGTLYYTTVPTESAPAKGDAAYSTTTDASKSVTYSSTGYYHAYVMLDDGTTTSDFTSEYISTGAVTLNTPVITFDGELAQNGSYYYPVVKLSSNNTSLPGSPSVDSYTATLNGNAIDVINNKVTLTEAGTLLVYSSTDGYSKSENAEYIGSQYAKVLVFDLDNKEVTQAMGYTGSSNTESLYGKTMTYYTIESNITDYLDGAYASGKLYEGYGLYTGNSGNCDLRFKSTVVSSNQVAHFVLGRFDGSNRLNSSYSNRWTIATTNIRQQQDRIFLNLMELYSPTTPATLGTNGYATFASPYALDLSKLPEGLTAYKASVSGTTVTFTEVNEPVKANTGLLLQGTASTTYSIPVTVSDNDISASNKFLVNTTGETFTGDNDYYYFGLKANTLTFGLFDPSSVAIPANKAYLMVARSDVAGARALTIMFGDETTGINTVETASQTNGQTYNLSGQRVAAPQKGLYIVNGKKVIIK